MVSLEQATHTHTHSQGPVHHPLNMGLPPHIFGIRQCSFCYNIFLIPVLWIGNGNVYWCDVENPRKEGGYGKEDAGTGIGVDTILMWNE